MRCHLFAYCGAYVLYFAHNYTEPWCPFILRSLSNIFSLLFSSVTCPSNSLTLLTLSEEGITSRRWNVYENCYTADDGLRSACVSFSIVSLRMYYFSFYYCILIFSFILNFCIYFFIHSFYSKNCISCQPLLFVCVQRFFLISFPQRMLFDISRWNINMHSKF